MGGFDFEWKGKTYDVPCEGGCPFFETEAAERAFEEWRMTKGGISLFGPVPTDWSKEHYLDDRYPFDHDKGHRVDVDDPDAEEEPDIDWCYYDKCRYGCYRHFLETSEGRTCGKCHVSSCKKCAKGSFKNCAGKHCGTWVCGDHEKCEDCENEDEESEPEYSMSEAPLPIQSSAEVKVKREEYEADTDDDESKTLAMRPREKNNGPDGTVAHDFDVNQLIKIDTDKVAAAGRHDDDVLRQLNEFAKKLGASVKKVSDIRNKEKRAAKRKRTAGESGC